VVVELFRKSWPVLQHTQRWPISEPDPENDGLGASAVKRLILRPFRIADNSLSILHEILTYVVASSLLTVTLFASGFPDIPG